VKDAGDHAEDPGKFGILGSALDPYIFHPFLVGAEGAGDGGKGGSAGGSAGDSGDGGGAASGSGDGGDGSGDGGGTGGNGTGDGGDGDGSGDGTEPKTFDQAYVEKLRKENAENRVKAKTALEELDKRKKAEMDDLTRAQTERDEEKTAREASETQLAQLRLELAVTQAATGANFHDPGDAMSLISPSEISLNDDGIPNKQSVEAAVKRLADAKPHLVKGKVPGTGDGGTRGRAPATVEEKQAEYQKQFQHAGGVPKPS
jgi:hypothetical protein